MTLHLRTVHIHFCDRLSLSLSIFLAVPFSLFRFFQQKRSNARRRDCYCCNFVRLDFLSRTYRENRCCINQSTPPVITPTRFAVVAVLVVAVVVYGGVIGRAATARALSRGNSHEITVIYPLFKRDTSYKRESLDRSFGETERRREREGERIRKIKRRG